MPANLNEVLSGLWHRREMLQFFLGAGLLTLGPPLALLGCSAPPPEIPPNRPDHAVDRFLKSMNCSQAVLETYAPALGMSVPLARRVAAPMAGGMGMGSECGAVTGALMVIGLRYGKTTDKDGQADHETFQRVAALLQEFQARHQHLGCSQLLGIDMSTPAGVQEAGRRGCFTSRCPVYVRSAAEILDKTLG
jgi:C_GCAxxG_C_C family probable redox protein